MQKLLHIPVSTQSGTDKKKSETMKRLWSDPEYRAMLVEKQKKAGLRAYGSKLNNFKKKYE